MKAKATNLLKYGVGSKLYYIEHEYRFDTLSYPQITVKYVEIKDIQKKDNLSEWHSFESYWYEFQLLDLNTKETFSITTGLDMNTFNLYETKEEVEEEILRLCDIMKESDIDSYKRKIDDIEKEIKEYQTQKTLMELKVSNRDKKYNILSNNTITKLKNL